MQIFEKAAYQVFSNRRLVLLLSATIALTAACGPSAKDSAAPVTTSAAPASSTARHSATMSVSASASMSSPRPTAASSSAPTKPPTRSVTPSQSGPTTADGCQAAALGVQALRGSGAAGHQYAFLQFTNRSAETCTLTGFPGVQLRRAGAELGKPAIRSDKATATVKLPPGASATARLVDASTCEAEKSDAVQIIPPNLTQRFVVPLSVRGCALTIDPVVAG